MAEMFQNAASALPRPEAGTLVARTHGSDWQACGAEGFHIHGNRLKIIDGYF